MISVLLILMGSLCVVLGIYGVIQTMWSLRETRSRDDQLTREARGRLLYPPRRTHEDAMDDEQPWRHNG